MMARGPERLEAFAQALATGVTPVQAARIAGYPTGSCFAHNARKRARREDVKEMVAELQKPVKEKLAKTIEANFEWATKRLGELTPSEAAELSKVIDSYARVLQSVEFEARLTKLEKATEK